MEQGARAALLKSSSDRKITSPAPQVGVAGGADETMLANAYALHPSQDSSKLLSVKFCKHTGLVHRIEYTDVDVEVPVKKLITVLASRMGVKNPSNQQLVYYDSSLRATQLASSHHNDSVAASKGDGGGASPHSQWGRDRKRMEDLDKAWSQHSVAIPPAGAQYLDVERTLSSQGFKHDNHTLELIPRVDFLTSKESTRSDESALDEEFEYFKKNFLAGAWPCTSYQAAKIAALHAHYTHDASDTRQQTNKKLVQERLKTCLPVDYQKEKDILKEAMSEFNELRSLPCDNFRWTYVQHCRQLSTCHATYFIVKAPTAKRRAVTPCILGISPMSVVQIDTASRQIMEVWRLSSIARVGTSDSCFSINFRDKGMYSVMTFQAEDLEAALTYHTKIFRDGQKSSPRKSPSKVSAQYRTLPSPPSQTTPSAPPIHMMTGSDSNDAYAVPTEPQQPLYFVLEKGDRTSYTSRSSVSSTSTCSSTVSSERHYPAGSLESGSMGLYEVGDDEVTATSSLTDNMASLSVSPRATYLSDTAGADEQGYVEMQQPLRRVTLPREKPLAKYNTSSSNDVTQPSPPICANPMCTYETLANTSIASPNILRERPALPPPVTSRHVNQPTSSDTGLEYLYVKSSPDTKSDRQAVAPIPRPRLNKPRSPRIQSASPSRTAARLSPNLVSPALSEQCSASRGNEATYFTTPPPATESNLYETRYLSVKNAGKTTAAPTSDFYMPLLQPN